MSKILVVDDKPLMRDSVAATLARAGFRPVAADSAESALRLIPRHRPAAVVTDLKLGGMDGISLLQRLGDTEPALPVVLMTAYASVETAVRALKLGAFDYIRKPFEPEELTTIVRRAVGREPGRIDACGEPRPPRPLLGNSTAMRRLRQQIATVATARGAVLITGESGTGKELAAHAVHAQSDRRHKPMLCLNCAALSEGLLESELFGHERGAFTGADQARQGRFELADGGTLLLDEVSEIHPRLQAKLLRVLQERAFERVGSGVTRPVDVRVIATTNRDLVEAVRRGEFRRDLYFRLHVLPLHMPPLRARIEDLPVLVNHFLARHGLQMSAAAMGLLQRHSWPGNVRELENLCERAAVFSTGPVIEAELIEPWLAVDASPAALPAGSHTLEEIERQTIVQALSRYQGHRQRTAQALGIGVRTLGLKLKKWKEHNLVAGSL